LSRKAIVGAGIDVLAREPPSVEDPLIRCDRAVLTPHVGYNTPTATAERSGSRRRTYCTSPKARRFNVFT
jgi:phosphoglycerate dehydrogenase-like enzyme